MGIVMITIQTLEDCTLVAKDVGMPKDFRKSVEGESHARNEEKVLVKLITHLTTTEHPARHSFIIDMAQEIRR